MSTAGDAGSYGAGSGHVAGSSAQLIVAAVAGWRARSPGGLVVAIDGYGAAGKTTLADAVARELGAEVLHTDDYFHPASAGTGTAPMAQYYDWTRMREEAILPALVRAGVARSDASSDAITEGALATGTVTASLLIEGVSAACPALADLVTHAVYVDTPESARIGRLRDRITPEEWDEEWLAAERVYFAARPPSSFDLVVPGA